MGSLRPVSAFVILLLLASAAGAEPCVLEPRVAREESDTWKRVSWCSEYRGYFQVDGEVWTVYEAIAMKEAPTSENCRLAASDPKKEYVGNFYIRHRSLPFGFLRVCLNAGIRSAQINGFLQRDGRNAPYFSGGSDYSCGEKDALVIRIK